MDKFLISIQVTWLVGISGFVGIEISAGGGKPLALKLSKAARRSDSNSSSSSPLMLQFDIVYR